MPPLRPEDITPGLVIHLDTEVLRREGGSLTNAQVTADEDRAVTGAHDFVIAMVDAKARRVTALPLFPRSAPGSAPLDDRLRNGSAEWMAHPVYYSRWQHWQIPVDALLAASTGEGAPRFYASTSPDTLQDLANWATRNRCVFRPA
jgi:hypothetical protein